MPIVTKLLCVAAFFLWCYLVHLLRPYAGGSGGGGRAGSGSGNGNQQGKGENQGQAGRVSTLQQLMKENKDLFKCLMRRAGMGHMPLSDTSDSRKLVDMLARRIRLDELELAEIAHKQTDLDLDLRSRFKRDEVNYPTDDIEPVPMRSLEQMTSVVPEQLLADDDEFYRLLLNQEMMILQAHNTSVDKKTLHILLDVSGSMNDKLENDVVRHTWSRAVAISLLLKALKEDANYFGRSFDTDVHQLWKSSNPQEAQTVIDMIFDRGVSGGGTNIFTALSRAVHDVQPLVDEFGDADILIITDGVDESMDNTEAVRQLLKGKIRLHVACIHNESPALQRVATTYKVIR